MLLTGTPIQNNSTELWSLLNFIQPKIFNSSEEFQKEYGDIKTQDAVDKLHTAVAPYLMRSVRMLRFVPGACLDDAVACARRMKEDVAKKIPPKEETVIEVELTPLQKQVPRTPPCDLLELS